MCLTDCIGPRESKRAPACCRLGQKDAGFSHDYSLGPGTKGRKWVSMLAGIIHLGHNHLLVRFTLTFLQ